MMPDVPDFQFAFETVPLTDNRGITLMERRVVSGEAPDNWPRFACEVRVQIGMTAEGPLISANTILIERAAEQIRREGLKQMTKKRIIDTRLLKQDGPPISLTGRMNGR